MTERIVNSIMRHTKISDIDARETLANFMLIRSFDL